MYYASKLITKRLTARPRMNGFERSLRSMEPKFSAQLERRDRVLKDSRDVISACSRTIIYVHTRKVKEAERELASAKSLLGSLKKASDSAASRYIISPEAEFVEASAVVAMAKGKPIPSIEDLGASPEAYLLGLLDTVGELKRLVLDSIMQRKLAKAKQYFEVMQELYSACSPLAVYDHVVNGARRKIDVARMLVEDTRGLLAEEMGRDSVSASMARLEKKLAGKTRG
jgi:translin